MLVVQNTAEFRIELPTIVTIGTFDGVHLGHQKILNRLKEVKKQTQLKTVVLTFEPHPRKILFPEQNDLKLLSSIEEKLQLLENYGIDFTVVYPFNLEFANSSPKFYVEEILIKQLHTKHLVIGYDHKFAKDRKGDIHFLKQYENHFFVEEISALDLNSIAVSSSKTRKLLEQGNVELANDYLGHPYFLMAKVVRGKQLGRTLGFPTANLELYADEKLIPKNGVYFVSIIFDNELYYGMMNIGTNPTTDKDNNIKLEVNIFDFEKEIYDLNLKVNFLHRLRDELKFNSLEDLKIAIAQDRENCMQLISQLV